MELNKDALEQVKKRYGSLGVEITPARRKMAIMPAGAHPIPNRIGSAPGMFLEHRRVMLFSLPGVPKEMMEMFNSGALRLIRSKAQVGAFAERSFTLKGIPESALAPVIGGWVRSHPDVYLKSHPSGGEELPVITIHLSAMGDDPSKLEKELLGAERSFSKALLKLNRRKG
jgi:molybdopterin-biosynthesis enzyme MoeA-like protein